MSPARRSTLLATLALLVVPAVAAAQPGMARPDLSPAVRFGGGFVFSLVVGAILLAAAPGYADRIIARVREDTGASLLWGIGIFVGFIGAFVVLMITVIGIVIAIPMLIVFVVVAILGNVLGYLAVFVGLVESRWVALLLASGLAALLGAIPVLGDLIGFAVGSIGVGAIVRDWRD